MEILASLANLFGQSRYLAHSICLSNDPLLVPLFQISDGSIGLSYFIIGGVLYFCYCRKDRVIRLVLAIMNDNVFLKLFFLFIIACGTIHIARLLTLNFGVYYLEGFTMFVTAIISTFTAIRVVAAVWDRQRQTASLDKLSGEPAPPHESRPLNLPNERLQSLSDRHPPPSGPLVS